MKYIYIYRYIFLGFSSSKKKRKKKRGRTLNGLLPIEHEEEIGVGRVGWVRRRAGMGVGRTDAGAHGCWASGRWALGAGRTGGRRRAALGRTGRWGEQAGGHWGGQAGGRVGRERQA